MFWLQTNVLRTGMLVTNRHRTHDTVWFAADILTNVVVSNVDSMLVVYLSLKDARLVFVIVFFMVFLSQRPLSQSGRWSRILQKIEGYL